MNKKQTIQTNTPGQALTHLNKGEARQPITEKTESPVIMHEAQIITPQPYGVFALCKIFEYLQIN